MHKQRSLYRAHGQPAGNISDEDPVHYAWRLQIKLIAPSLNLTWNLNILPQHILGISFFLSVYLFRYISIYLTISILYTYPSIYLMYI